MKCKIIILIIIIITLSCGKKEDIVNVVNNEIKVSFVTDTELDTLVIEKGKKIDAPKPITKENFIFDKWLLNRIEYDFSKPVNQNITLVASWKENKKDTIKIHLNYGTTTKTLMIEEGKTLNELNIDYSPITNKDFYIFNWLHEKRTYGYDTPIVEEITLELVKKNIMEGRLFIGGGEIDNLYVYFKEKTIEVFTLDKLKSEAVEPKYIIKDINNIKITYYIF